MSAILNSDGGPEMVQKHRTFSAEFTFQVVMDIVTGMKTTSEICREHQIAEGVVHRWRKEFLEKGPQIFERPSRKRPDENRIGELERMIGQLTVELTGVKKVSDWLDSL
jgi:transposase-like protein